jgi:erythrin-vacuolar iron transport family protein
VDKDDKDFLLQVVQPGLVGLMDGSVSTLAPIFAAAFATGSSHVAFVIGMSAAVGAGISMAFAEALSDTGHITGRGHPFARGGIIGIMTFVGGLFHTLPFLIPNVHVALYSAFAVVVVELMVIAYIRFHYFKMSFTYSTIQVLFGGGLVVAAGLLLGVS